MRKKRQIVLLLWTLTVLMTSCAKQLEKFVLRNDSTITTITFYSDSTFKEVVENSIEKISYSRTWTGSLEEDSIISTISTKRNSSIITLTPKKDYKIVKGQLELLITQ